jgi:hypothetical protein
LSFAAIACAAAGVARADDVPQQPPPPRVIHAPTAHLQPSLTAFGSVGATQHGLGMASLTTGLGELAEVAIIVDDDVATCSGCTDDEPHARALLIASAQFKVGVNEGRAATWQPALALGFRRSVGSPLGDDSPGDYDTVEVARLYAAASKTLGPLSVHAGVDIWDAEVTLEGDTTFLHDRPLAKRTRPFLGLAFASPQTPRTSLMTDIAWTPVVDGGEASLRYVTGLGVRYQAFDWSSIELGVRHRQGDALDETTFMVRLNAVVPPP